jgi:hypothetical protein
MRLVPVQATPNQSFTLTIDNVRYGLRLRDLGGVMCADVVIDGETIMYGCRVLAGEPVIPYRYLENGNFVFLTLDGDLPDWRQFGLTQSLVYLSDAELAAIPATTAGDVVQPVGYLFTDGGFYITTDTGALIEDA